MKTRAWVGPVMRLGFAAKGVVYILVGGLAAMAALGASGGRITDPPGALRAVGRHSYGEAVIGTVAVGLACYALWRVVQALEDVDRKGNGLRGLAARAGFLGNGLAHGTLAFTAARITLGLDTRGWPLREWTARVLAAPMGVELVAAGGIGVMGAGLYQLYKAYAEKFHDDLATYRMSARQERWAVRVGRFGLSARAVTFLVIGWFLLQAARELDPSAARGLEGALRTLRRQYGSAVLGTVAVGFVAFGVHSLITARYRRVAG